MKTLIQTVALLLSVSLISCEKEPLVQGEENSASYSDFENERKTRGKGGSKVAKEDRKIKVCHTNSEILNIDYHGAYSHIEHGDILFSCNPQDGVSFKDIEKDLKRIVKDNGGDVSKKNDMKKAFEEWYIDEYLTGEWTKDDNKNNSTSGGIGSGGIGGGSL